MKTASCAENQMHIQQRLQATTRGIESQRDEARETELDLLWKLIDDRYVCRLIHT